VGFGTDRISPLGILTALMSGFLGLGSGRLLRDQDPATAARTLASNLKEKYGDGFPTFERSSYSQVGVKAAQTNSVMVLMVSI
jgi:hypothetical protein